MEKLYDIVAKTGSYQKDGETKNRYLNVGSIIKGDNGPYMIMERTFNPAGLPNPEDRSSLILSLFKPRDKADGAARMPSQDATRSFEDVRSAIGQKEVNHQPVNSFNDEGVPF